MNNLEKKNYYKKQNSFISFKRTDETTPENTKERIKSVLLDKKNFLDLSENHQKILNRALDDIFEKKNNDLNSFKLTENTIAEIYTIDDRKLLNYLVHRYRYEVFPNIKEIDDFPPLLQIEPSSVCNFRCVFCFETDTSFTNKKNGFMGRMELDLFKKIIDQAEGNIEFLTLASRGEPLICPDFDKMLIYSKDKFLNLKINTNASKLDEKKCHSILSSGVKTIVFSADAADEKLYSKLRVNGKLSQVLKNIERFKKIRETKYKDSKIISRVSGVKFTNEQNEDEMFKLWNGLVDQVVFVNYNPWENTYNKSANKMDTACSDLWRRMFIWWDGNANPCDVDYKSTLSVGNFKKNSISSLWKSEKYNSYRKKHISKNRQSISPCKSCTVI